MFFVECKEKEKKMKYIFYTHYAYYAFVYLNEKKKYKKNQRIVEKEANAFLFFSSPVSFNSLSIFFVVLFLFFLSF